MPAEKIKIYCPVHERNTASINRQKGMWTMLIVIVGLAISGGWYMIDQIEQQARIDRQILIEQVDKLSTTSQSIDKAITNYISLDNQRTRELYRVLDDHEKRIRILEHQK